MFPLRPEVRSSVRACQQVLSLNLRDELDQEERDLLAFYMKEVLQELSWAERALLDRQHHAVPH